MDAEGREPGRDRAPRVMRLLQANGRAAWNLVGILVAIGLLGFVFSRLQLILFTIFVALVHAAIITPVARWFERRGLGRRLASALGLLVVVVSLSGVTGLVAYRLVEQLPGVVEQVQSQRSTAMTLLARPPLSLNEDEIDEMFDRGVEQVAESDAGAAEGGSDASDESSDSSDEDESDDGEGPSPDTAFALLQAGAMGVQLAGFALAGVVLSFFLVRDRDRITEGLVRHLAGGGHGDSGRAVLRSAWHALDGYVRASVIVGAVEGIAIGIVLLIVGTPLAGVLAILTFAAAFVPVVGAIVAGVLSVLMTWIGVGPVQAVIVGVVVLVVQQVDSNLLQPTIVANHTRLHPIATILALLVGGLVGGLLGALLAVPTAAVLVAVGGELLSPSSPSSTANGEGVAAS